MKIKKYVFLVIIIFVLIIIGVLIKKQIRENMETKIHATGVFNELRFFTGDHKVLIQAANAGSPGGRF